MSMPVFGEVPPSERDIKIVTAYLKEMLLQGLREWLSSDELNRRKKVINLGVRVEVHASAELVTEQVDTAVRHFFSMRKPLKGRVRFNQEVNGGFTIGLCLFADGEHFVHVAKPLRPPLNNLYSYDEPTSNRTSIMSLPAHEVCETWSRSGASLTSVEEEFIRAEKQQTPAFQMEYDPHPRSTQSFPKPDKVPKKVNKVVNKKKVFKESMKDIKQILAGDDES